MILFVILLFSCTLFFAQNKNRVNSPISNARRNWCYILGFIGAIQVLMSFTHTHAYKSLVIGLFLMEWAWFVHTARRGQKITWKSVLKTIVLVLSSLVYLATVDNPYSWAPVIIQALLMGIVLVLRLNFCKTHKNKTSTAILSDNHTEEVVVIKQQSLPKISKRTKRMLYWIVGVILFIIILPFIIFAIDKTIDGYMNYYHSVQNIGKVEEVDSVVIYDDLTENITYYDSEENMEIYPIERDSVVNDSEELAYNTDSAVERLYYDVNPYLKTYSTGNPKADLENIIIAQNKYCPLRILDGMYIAVVKEEPHYVTMYTVVDESIFDFSKLSSNNIITTMKNAMTDYIISSNNADELYRQTMALYVANGKGLKFHYYGNQTNKSFDLNFSCEELNRLVQI